MMFRLLFVGFIHLSILGIAHLGTAHADWTNPLRHAGFSGQTRPIPGFSGNMLMVRETRYRPFPIPGWPRMDAQFSDELLHAHSLARFHLALTPYALPNRAIVLALPDLPYPVLLLTPTADAAVLAREVRQLADHQLSLAPTLSRRLREAGFAPDRAAWLVELVMQTRAESIAMSLGSDPFLIDAHVFKWQPYLDYLHYLRGISPARALIFVDLMKTYLSDLPPNAFQDAAIRHFDGCAGAIGR